MRLTLLLLGSLLFTGCVAYDDGPVYRERAAYYRDRPGWYDPGYPYYRDGRDYHANRWHEDQRARAAAYRDERERHEWREHHDRDWH